MELFFSEFERKVLVFLLKSFLVLATIFAVGISILIFKDALLFNNTIVKNIVLILIGAVTLIITLSNINIYNKIK